MYLIMKKSETDPKKKFWVGGDSSATARYGSREQARRVTFEAGRRRIQVHQEDAAAGRCAADRAADILVDLGLNEVHAGERFQNVAPAAPTAPVQKQLPKSIKAVDGSWRKLPPMSLKSGGWIIPYALLFKGTPYSGYFKGATPEELIAEVSNINEPFIAAWVATLPPGPPEKEEAAPVEHVPTQAELDRVVMLDENTYNRMDAKTFGLKYQADPLFKAAADKLFAFQRRREDAFRAKEVQEEEERRAAAARRELAVRG
jgi:hypothetical protein